MNCPDLHKVLGISKSSSPEAVRRAFREFAKASHPDLYPGDKMREEVFKSVNAAYQRWKVIESTLEEMRRVKQVKVKKVKYPEFDTYQRWRVRCKA